MGTRLRRTDQARDREIIATLYEAVREGLGISTHKPTKKRKVRPKQYSNPGGINAKQATNGQREVPLGTLAHAFVLPSLDERIYMDELFRVIEGASNRLPEAERVIIQCEMNGYEEGDIMLMLSEDTSLFITNRTFPKLKRKAHDHLKQLILIALRERPN